jgi:predicted AlkP superfamily pyrophosphatase or phosphodiesterase
MSIEGRVLNVLRWATPEGDARSLMPPTSFQWHEPFGGQRPPVVTRAEFANSGFTDAHLGGVRFVGYRTLGTLVAEIDRLVRAGEPFVYAYYEGVDKVSHEYGLGAHYDQEVRWVDHLVSELLSVLPAGTCLALTADHGQVEVGDNLVELDAGIRDHLSMQSGEGRFRWLHARPGRSRQLLEAAQAHADTGWVVSREQTIDEGWFGPRVRDAARNRLGDVALVAREPVAYVDPLDSGPYSLIGRHGSLTEAEMLVPFVAATT